MVPRFSRSYGCLTVVLQFVILSQSDRARVMRKLEHVFRTTRTDAVSSYRCLLPPAMSGVLSESQEASVYGVYVLFVCGHHDTEYRRKVV